MRKLNNLVKFPAHSNHELTRLSSKTPPRGLVRQEQGRLIPNEIPQNQVDALNKLALSSVPQIGKINFKSSGGMRYVGSKRRLSRFIARYIQRALRAYPNGAYIEPFLGGANMITKIDHHTKIGYDANSYLIALYNAAKYNPDKLREIKTISREAYKYVKKNIHLFEDWYAGAIGFLPTYSNIWMGTYFEDVEPGRFSKCLNSLLKMDLDTYKFLYADYKSIPIGRGNVIYCDPPYKIRDYYGMTFNHDEFYEWVRQASKYNIVIVSEYEMPYDFTCIWQMEVKPRINNNSSPKFEKLFIYNRKSS